MRNHGKWARRRAPAAIALAAVVILIVLLGSSTALAAPPWSDAPNSWWMSTYGITETQAGTVSDGYPNGVFRPGQAVTRAQFAKMTVDGFNLGTANPAVATFPDVPKSNYFFPWIEGAVDAGIIGGYTDGNFRPNNNIIRQQANSLLGKYLAGRELTLRGHIAGDDGNYPSLAAWYAVEGSAILAQFADAASVATVHAAPTAYLVYHEVVEGSGSGSLRYLSPNQNVTRAQAVALVIRTREVSFTTALPAITLLNPAYGPAAGGNIVTITGTNLGGATIVQFGTNKAASFTVDSAMQIRAVAPAGITGTIVDVRVTTPAGTSVTSAATKYSYGVPVITGLDPAAGPAAGGTTVVITGTNFNGVEAVRFGDKNAASFTVNSATQITAVAPPGTNGTTVDVTVIISGGVASPASAATKYSYGAPAVTSLDPAAGLAAGGTKVDIRGTGFTGLSGAAAVKFGDKNATSYTVVSPTLIEAVAPAGTNGTTVDVTVTNPVGTSPTTGTGNDYAYGIPTVTDVVPDTGSILGGDPVTITGTGFVPGAIVRFGGANYPATSVVVVSPTTITCVTPAHPAGVVSVTVTTPAGTSSTEGTANDFTYGIPTVTALTPNGGPVAGGTSVTITGTNFTAPATVKFGDTNAKNITVVNVTTITCTAPAHAAGVVDVTVTTSAGTSSTEGAGNDFAYGAPTVTGLNPTGGPVGGGTVVTITGTGFVPGATVKFGDTNATNVTVVSRTSITATAPAKPGGGVVNVVVTTSGGASDPSGSANDYLYGNLHLVVSGISDPATAGTAYSVTVTVYDEGNNVFTDYVGTIHFSSNDPLAVLPANYTFTAGDNGTHTFTNGVTLKTAGAGKVVTATDVATPSITGSQSVTVNPAAAHHLAFDQQPTNTVAGVAIDPAVTVRIVDAFGNLVTSTAEVTIAFGNNAGGGTLSGTKTKNAVAGIAEFNDLSIDKAGTGYTLAASATSLTGATSSAFNITAAAAHHLAFGQQPTNTTAGGTIAAVTVRIEDEFGNLVTSTASVTIAIGTDPSGDATLGGTLTKNAVAGIATFNDLSIDKAGTGYTLAASATSLTGATSDAFDIT